MEYDDRKRKRFVNTITGENGKFQYDIHPWVFFVSAFIIAVGVVTTILAGHLAKDVFFTFKIIFRNIWVGFMC